MGRRCCCGAGCTICEDDFDRDNSPAEDPIADVSPWVEESGCSIVNDTLEVTAGGSGYCPIPHPHTTPTGLGWVTCKNMQSGNRYIIAVNYDPPGLGGDGSYEGVELECISATEFHLYLVDQDGRVSCNTCDTVTDGALAYEAGQDLVLKICRNMWGVYGTITTISWPVWQCRSDSPGGYYMMLKNPGSNTVYFDNAIYQEHKITDDDCQNCHCECKGYCVAETLVVTLVSSCEHRDGLTCELTLDKSAYPEFEWAGSQSWLKALTPEQEDEKYFRLYCGEIFPGDCPDGDPAGQFVLWSTGFQDDCSTSGWMQAGHECPVSIQCNPLVIEYREVTCAGSGEPAPTPCTEHLIITPAA